MYVCRGKLMCLVEIEHRTNTTTTTCTRRGCNNGWGESTGARGGGGGGDTFSQKTSSCIINQKSHSLFSVVVEGSSASKLNHHKRCRTLAPNSLNILKGSKPNVITFTSPIVHVTPLFLTFSPRVWRAVLTRV